MAEIKSEVGMVKNYERSAIKSWPLVLVDSTARIASSDRKQERRKVAQFKIFDCDRSGDARAVRFKVNRRWVCN